MVTPMYLSLVENGTLAERAARLPELLHSCTLCGHTCRKDRLARQRGICLTGERARVASYGPHHGEERPISGWRGSGTIFFSQCNLRCQFCQNADISHANAGYEVDAKDLAAIMLELQALGCHNINFVSPTHVAPQITAGVLLAAQAGLRLPLVYNTGGFDSLDLLQLLDGIIDIYLPDMKYSAPQTGLRYSKARQYPQVNQAAVREMQRQVGELRLDEHGLAYRGLLVRHLVLPHGAAGTPEIAAFLAAEISPNTYLNVMDQYHPAYNARQFSQLNRRITRQEYEDALEAVRQAGLTRLDQG
jgi:putative pyruvate formate lyase activating enzyme